MPTAVKPKPKRRRKPDPLTPNMIRLLRLAGDGAPLTVAKKVKGNPGCAAGGLAHAKKALVKRSLINSRGYLTKTGRAALHQFDAKKAK